MHFLLPCPSGGGQQQVCFEVACTQSACQAYAAKVLSTMALELVKDTHGLVQDHCCQVQVADSFI